MVVPVYSRLYILLEDVSSPVELLKVSVFSIIKSLIVTLSPSIYIKELSWPKALIIGALNSPIEKKVNGPLNKSFSPGSSLPV